MFGTPYEPFQLFGAYFYTVLYCTPDYPCPDNPVCGLSVRDFKLVMANDEGGTKRDLAPNAQTGCPNYPCALIRTTSPVNRDYTVLINEDRG